MVQSASVLIVDDSDSTRLVMACILRKAGYSVEEARNGMEAIDMARGKKYAVIITDLHMPGMGGDSLVTRLRATSKYQFTPILIATAQALDETKMIGGEVRATGWITKPIKPAKLLASLRRLLEVS